MVLVQSERSPDYLESRIEAYLRKSGFDLEAMTIDDFEGHRRSLIAKRLEKLKNLESETARLWGYIGSETMDFYQIDREVAEIRLLTKADVLQFYKTYISPDSQTRAKLS
jgi:insulysin